MSDDGYGGVGEGTEEEAEEEGLLLLLLVLLLVFGMALLYTVAIDGRVTPPMTASSCSSLLKLILYFTHSSSVSWSPSNNSGRDEGIGYGGCVGGWDVCCGIGGCCCCCDC